MAHDMIFYTAHEMQILRTDTFYKRNPHWPHPDGGQWTDGGRTPFVDIVVDDPPLRPVFPLEILVGSLVGITYVSAKILVRVLLGYGDRIYRHQKFLRIKKNLEQFFDGKPVVFRNKAGDVVMMRQNKKIRFDLNNTHRDKPHFHIQEGFQNGKKIDWRDIGPHRHYFKDGG
ncbi:MAG: hypothetical protein EBZ69_10120 [Alphaproteobacteria bacterium]|nr:hypothetical protein [Alphaproteobacteria bacterium]